MLAGQPEQKMLLYDNTGDKTILGLSSYKAHCVILKHQMEDNKASLKH